MVGLYKIANLNVKLNVPCKRLENNLKPYKIDDQTNKVDFTIDITEEQVNNLLKKYNNSGTFENAAYILSGSIFNRKIINYNAVMLHASAISYNGCGIAFSANSGVGKSTHANLWLNRFKNNCVIINDDKPVIRKFNNKYYICGTPWSGKTDLNNNVAVPLKAIVFIERSDKNKLLPLNKTAAAPLFIQQTLRLKNTDLLNKSFSTISNILDETSVFKLNCNISQQAVDEAFKILK